jgi:hypothetical protein
MQGLEGYFASLCDVRRVNGSVCEGKKFDMTSLKIFCFFKLSM